MAREEVTQEGDGDVFRALADPTRRAILDALFTDDGQTLAALSDRFPEMTRFGVMKHLALLEGANLVLTTRAGRTKLHFLNPVPIAQIADRWISKYTARYGAALVELDHQVARQRSDPAPAQTDTAAPQTD